MSSLFSLRLGREGDHPFVVDSWVTSDQDAPDGWTNRSKYMREAKAFVRALLARDNVMLRVAHVPDDDDAILGWAAVELGESPVVHYVYVRGGKSGARRLGVAKALVADFIGHRLVQYTHRPCDKSVRIPDGWTYAPQRAL